MNRIDGKTSDRRIQRTKRSLLDSFTTLVFEKGYDNITIQDIVDHANVGRSTFYSHFQNKDELLCGGESLRIVLQENGVLKTGEENQGANLERLYLYVAGNHALMRALSERSPHNVVTGLMMNVMTFIIHESLRDRQVEGQVADEMRKIVTDACASALTSLLAGWVAQGMIFTTKQMAHKSCEVMRGIVGQYLPCMDDQPVTPESVHGMI